MLVITEAHPEIEKKTARDRDRNAFGGELMQAFYRVFVRKSVRYDRRAVEAVLLRARERCWEQGRGHPLMEEMAARYGYAGPDTLLDEKAARRIFGDRYFARSPSPGQPAERLRLEEQERRWKEEGRRPFPGYYARFGLPTAERHFKELERKAREEAERAGTRAPTDAKKAALSVLRGALREFAPDVEAVLARRDTSYTVAQTEALLGQLKSANRYRSLEVYLGASVFEGDFAAALAVYLHEHAHIFGYDGSRGFTDALTQLIEALVRDRALLAAPEGRWEAARERMARERRESPVLPPDEGEAARALAGMGEEDLRRLLARMPSSTLRRVLREHLDKQ